VPGSDSLHADDAVRDAAAAIRCAVKDDLEGLVAIARNADPVPTFVGLATFCSYLLDEHLTLLTRSGGRASPGRGREHAPGC
jgi:hypothetical protein